MLKVKIAKSETEVKDPHAEFALSSFVELKNEIDPDDKTHERTQGGFD